MASSSGETRNGNTRSTSRTFGLDVLACKRCGGRMRLLAMVTEHASLVRYFASLGETR